MNAVDFRPDGSRAAQVLVANGARVIEGRSHLGMTPRQGLSSIFARTPATQPRPIECPTDARVAAATPAQSRVLRRVTGERLRDFRLNKGLLQRDVARLAGISQAGLSNYEQGSRELSLYVAIRITAVLGISVADLVDGLDIIVTPAAQEFRPAEREV